MRAATPGTDATPLFAGSGAGTARLVVYLSLAVTLMVADYHGRYLDRVRRSAATLVGPIHWLASSPGRVIDATGAALADRRQLAAENERLRQDLLLSQARLARLGAVQDQNSRLRELLDARSRLGLKVQLAELVDVDLDPFRHRILIDRGSGDGVRVGQAVMDGRGVMGQILETYADRALMILITDPGHAVPVRVVRSGLRTVAYGTGDVATLRLPHIPFSAEIRVGDQLVTSGLGGHFPAGLPVGMVRQVEPDDSATFVLAFATPSAGMARGGEVLVLYDERERYRAAGYPDYEFVGPPEALPVRTPAAGGGAR